MNKGNYCTLYLIRHGESEGNIKGLVQGHFDAPLTENGIKQAQEAAERFKDIEFDVIFSSDLMRAKHTAEIIRLERDLLVKTSKLLRERTFGEFDGMESKEYIKLFKDDLLILDALAWEERRHYKVHDSIETDNEMVSRFITHLREIAIAYPAKTVLVGTHGGPLRALLIQLGWGTPQELPGGSFKNTGYIILESDGVDFFVKEVVGVNKPS